MDNVFVELTKRMLKKGYDSELLSTPGFIAHVDNNKESVLIIGLNPAGGKKDADRERDGNLFLNYIPIDCKDNSYKAIEELTNNTFSCELYKAMESVLGKANFIWDWCNEENIIENYDERMRKFNNIGFEDEEIKIIQQFMDDRKNAKYQVHIGDLFYYHQTSSFVDAIKYHYTRDTKKNPYDLNPHVISMLDEHIKALGKKPKFIYINSALASHYIDRALREEKGLEIKDFGGFLYNGIPIVLGAAFSGLGAMDSFSRKRVEVILREIIEGNFKL